RMSRRPCSSVNTCDNQRRLRARSTAVRRSIALELVSGRFICVTHVGVDFFDASINRVAGWVIGARNMLKALLKALPVGRAWLDEVKRYEHDVQLKRT